MIDHRASPSRLPRWLRGLLSTVSAPLGWLGRGFGWTLRRFRTPERYAHGLVIVLPGIESESFLNHGIAWGLSDAGWEGAIEVEDWTTTLVLLFAYHLRSWKRNLRQAERIAKRIVVYRGQHPGRPVHLVGHSGGGAMAVLILEALPTDQRVTSAILLAPALSPRYPLMMALDRTEQGIWNFWSYFDVIFCGTGTLLLGTLDGKWQPSAGMIGFLSPPQSTAEDQALYRSKLHQRGYSLDMVRAFHLGGHFGCVNRVFVELWIGPLLEHRRRLQNEPR